MALKHHQIKKLRIMRKKVVKFDNDHLIKCKLKQADLWMWEDGSEYSERLVEIFNNEIQRRLGHLRGLARSWDYDGDWQQKRWLREVRTNQKRLQEALDF